MIEPLEVVAPDGWRLRGELHVPPSPRAVAVVGHAMMVDRRTLDRPRGGGFISHLVAHGVAVVGPDLRGHGQSGPRAEAGGRWSYDDLVADVPVLLDFARRRVPGVPLYAVGHSLFGHVTLAHLCRHPSTALDGLVLLGANMPIREWNARPHQRWQKRAFLELMALLCHLFGRFPTQRLGLGTNDESAAMMLDFVRCARAADWQAADGFSYASARARVTTPVLALVGAGDRLLSPPDEARAFAAPIGGLVEVQVVGRKSGLPFDPSHMGLVLDERARPVWDRVAAFLVDERRAVPPS
jgi:predicted alpha/beta hydrolase